MSLSNWLCNNSKSQFVKIVYPGGHVELHDRPVLAADIMIHNPRCCVAHPYVFQKPWAIVEPETVLTLGHKFYVVPISTIRKLQRCSLKYSPVRHNHDVEMVSPCSLDAEDQDHDLKEEFFSDQVKYCCFWVMIKLKGHNSGVYLRETKGFTRKRATTNEALIRGSPKRLASLDRSNSWQPNLESITEE